jgi:hypothetical protein
MRVNAARRAESLLEEDGGVVVFVGLIMPVILLFLAFSVDIGNWWVHKRHLQLQVDAAALAGGARFGQCFPDASVGNAAIEAEATRFGGGTGSTYNEQVGNANKGTIGALVYQSKTYPAGSNPADDTDERSPCEALEFDVKASEADLPLLFQIPGLSSVDAINAHARVELKKVRIFEGMLPLAVPEIRPRRVTATFVDESGLAVGAPFELSGPTVSSGLANWTGSGSVPVQAGKKLGVRIGMGQNSGTCAAANGDGGLGYACFDAQNYSTGLVAVSGFSGSGAGSRNDPTAASFEVWPVTACSGSPYFSDASLSGGATTCGTGVQAKVRIATGLPIDPTQVEFKAKINGPGVNNETADLRYTPATGVWSTDGYPFALPLGEGKYDISLEWKYDGSSGPSRKFPDLQQVYSAGDDSGPIKLVSLTGGGAPATTAYSLAEGTQTLTVNVTLQGSLELSAPGETVLLRLTSGSRTSAVACDGPGVSLFRTSIISGCTTPYQINEIGYCPDPANPDPSDCVATQTGDFGTPTTQALDERYASCPPYSYPNYPEDDPRVVILMVTDLSALTGSGTTDIPVTNFAAFYIGGWTGSGCANNAPEPSGLKPTDRAIWGHFVFYARPNPQNASDETCDPTLITPCVPVMTR